MRAAYDAIYFDLRDSVSKGKYRYKDFLPSESILVQRYHCAHNTVRKAIGLLAQEGYVLPIHGKGVRVIYRSTPLLNEKRSEFEPNGLESFAKAGKRLGFSAKTKVLSMEKIVADKEFARQTGFEANTELVRMERVRYYDNVPLERETNYFRSNTVAGITRRDAEKSVIAYIEDKLGIKLVTSKRVITVEKANERDFELLEMGDADYVVALTVATYDGDGLVCEVTKMRHHPHKFSFSSTAIRTSVNSA